MLTVCRAMAVSATVLISLHVASAANASDIIDGLTPTEFDAYLAANPDVEIIERFRTSQGPVTANGILVKSHGAPAILTLLCLEDEPRCGTLSIMSFYGDMRAELEAINFINFGNYTPFSLKQSPRNGTVVVSGNVLLAEVSTKHIDMLLKAFPAAYVAFGQALGEVQRTVATEVGTDGLAEEPFDLVEGGLLSFGDIADAFADETLVNAASFDPSSLMDDPQIRAEMKKVLNDLLN